MNSTISPEIVRPLVQELLSSVMTERIKQADAIHTNYGQFWRILENNVLVGGKRFRPYLTVVAHGEINDDIIKIATAQELLHVAMLVHDDVIDKDLVRRGQKNITGRYVDIYGEELVDQDALHFANSAAILAGDALISQAYQLIHETNYPDTVKRMVSRQLGVSVFEVIAGELMDVEAAFYRSASFDPLNIYRYKTASYSLIGPLLSGAHCANRDEASLKALEKFATALGIAFQIQDDLLGLYGDAAATGKSTTGDLREGKRTLLIGCHELMMNEEQSSRFEKYFANENARDNEFEMLKQDIDDSGAKARTEDYMQQYYDQAEEVLSELVDKDLAQQLSDVMNGLRKRNS